MSLFKTSILYEFDQRTGIRKAAAGDRLLQAAAKQSARAALRPSSLRGDTASQIWSRSATRTVRVSEPCLTCNATTVPGAPLRSRARMS